MIKRRNIKTIIFTLIVISLSTASILFAQSSVNGSLRGQVKDTTQSNIVGVSLKLINLENNIQISSTTNQAGEYVFVRVTPGQYKLHLDKPGFQSQIHRNIVITVNDAATINIELTIGQINEAINIENSTELIHSQSSENSMLVNEARIRELPLNGKNFQRLIQLAPGAGGSNGSINNLSINGARPMTNNYSVDGASANDERASGGLSIDGGATGLSVAAPNLISTEAVQEFNIITSSADATYGRGSGGYINLITKSGTNNFHGSLYEYLRNDALDARDFFNHGPFRDAQGRAVVPPFKQNLFGATFGGPIIKDRHFIFGGYEGFRQRLERTASATVPNAELISLIPGDLQKLYKAFYIERGIIPSSGLSTGGTFVSLPSATITAARKAGFNPALLDGNINNGEAGQVILSTTNTQNLDQNSFMIRTDHRIKSNLNLSFRYAFAEPSLEFNQRAVSGVLQQNLRRWQSFAAQADYTITPNQILEIRSSLLRSRMRDKPSDSIETIFQQLGVDPQIGLTVNPTGTALSRLEIPGPLGFIDNQTVPQVSGQHIWSNGSWTLRSGMEIRHNILNNLRLSNAPFYQFNGFIGANGLIGATPTQQQAVALEASGTQYGNPTGPTTPQRGWRNTEQEYFSQFDWRIKQNLTLNLGIRYAYFGVMQEVNGVIANLYAVDPSGNIVDNVSPFKYGRTANIMVPVTSDRAFYQPDRNNIQPRIGGAWNIGKLSRLGETVLRASYGLYVDRQAAGLLEYGAINYPFATSAVFNNLSFTGAGNLPFTDTVPTQSRLIDPTLKSPETHRFWLGVEQMLGNNTSLSISYVSARGRSLYRFLEPNGQGAVPQQYRPDTRYSRQRYTTNASSSDYHSLQLFLRRRMAKAIDFSISYTFAKSLDDYSNDTGATSQAPSLINLGGSPASGFQGGGANQWIERDLRSDRGLSDFDVRHNLTLSHIIELPFGKGRNFFSNAKGTINNIIGGWSVAGLATIRSGEPVNLSLGADAADIGFSSYPRPALLSGNPSDLYDHGKTSRTQYFIAQSVAQQILGTPIPVTNPFAQLARNVLRSPAVKFYDLSLLKRFTLNEHINLTFEANAFNIFNNVNFAAPNSTLSSVTFGRIISTRNGTNPRQLQFGLKMAF